MKDTYINIRVSKELKAKLEKDWKRVLEGLWLREGSKEFSITFSEYLRSVLEGEVDERKHW